MASNGLSNIYNQLKSVVVGTKTQNIDSILNKAVKDIVDYKSNSGRNGYIDLIKTVISKSSVDTGSIGSANIFNQGHTGADSLGQGIRMNRYKMYESIVFNINYVYRALSVLTDNILSPDDITKISLDIKIKSFLENEIPTESKIQKVIKVIEKLKLEKNLGIIVRSTLEYGDFFCEIAPLKTALSSKSIISEANVYKEYIQNQITSGHIEIITQQIKNNNKLNNVNIKINYTSITEDNNIDIDIDNIEKKSSKDPFKILSNLSLIYHKPKFVVKLQSSLFPICFGYLVFPEVKGSNVYGNQFEDDGINDICASILNNLGKKIPQMAEFNDNEELANIVKFMLNNATPTKALEIRYVPPDKMTHFKVPSTKYYPYGESILDASQFTAKLLMALETALVIQRLAKSTEKRKIAVEVGLPRDAKKVIEGMKEEFRKRKISLDTFGSIDTIPSMITTFEDIYIPQKDGKPFVDISTFSEGNVDVRSKIDELKFIRDQLISTYNVPPSFLGIEENLSNKAALSEENILFARCVIGHQKYLSEQITDLVEKVFKIISPEDVLTLFQDITINLPTPKILQYERESRYMGDLIGLIENLERIGIPKEYSTRKYLSNIDWKEIKNYEIKNQIDDTLDKDKDKEPGGF